MTRKQARQSAATDDRRTRHPETRSGAPRGGLGRGFGKVTEQALRGLRRVARQRRKRDREIIAAIFDEGA